MSLNSIFNGFIHKYVQNNKLSRKIISCEMYGQESPSIPNYLCCMKYYCYTCIIHIGDDNITLGYTCLSCD